MARKSAFTTQSALELALKLEQYADGILANGNKYIFYDNFRKYIYSNFGSDKSTIRKYKTMLDELGFLSDIHDICRLEFIYKKSPYYVQSNRPADLNQRGLTDYTRDNI
jgi:hypothetical protein